MHTISKSGRKLLVPAEAEDKVINEGVEADADNPELGAEFFATALPATEVPALRAELEAGRI